MRLAPALTITAALCLTGGTLPHIAPAAWDALAAGMLCAGIAAAALTVRAAWKA